MKTYSLVIVYNEEEEEVEYINEELSESSDEVIMELGDLVLNDYFDEEGLGLIAGCYIVGET